MLLETDFFLQADPLERESTVTYVLCVEWMGEHKSRTQNGADQDSGWCCCWVQRDFSLFEPFLGSFRVSPEAVIRRI